MGETAWPWEMQGSQFFQQHPRRYGGRVKDHSHENDLQEQWRVIAGFEAYQVSDHGRVMGPRGIIKPHPAKRGYLIARISKGSKATRTERPVHILVAEAFLGPVP